MTFCDTVDAVLIYVLKVPDGSLHCFKFLVNKLQSPREKSSRLEAQAVSTTAKLSFFFLLRQRFI